MTSKPWKLSHEARQYSDALEALGRALVAEQAAVFVGETTQIEMTQALEWVRSTRHVYLNTHHRGLGPQSLTEEAS